MSPSQHEKNQKNLRLSQEAQRLLALISNMDGIGESAAMEILLRKEARVRGLLEETWMIDRVSRPPRHGN